MEDRPSKKSKRDRDEEKLPLTQAPEEHESIRLGRILCKILSENSGRYASLKNLGSLDEQQKKFVSGFESSVLKIWNIWITYGPPLRAKIGKVDMVISDPEEKKVQWVKVNQGGSEFKVTASAWISLCHNLEADIHLFEMVPVEVVKGILPGIEELHDSDAEKMRTVSDYLNRLVVSHQEDTNYGLLNLATNIAIMLSCLDTTFLVYDDCLLMEIFNVDEVQNIYLCTYSFEHLNLMSLHDSIPFKINSITDWREKDTTSGPAMLGHTELASVYLQGIGDILSKVLGSKAIDLNKLVFISPTDAIKHSDTSEFVSELEPMFTLNDHTLDVGLFHQCVTASRNSYVRYSEDQIESTNLNIPVRVSIYVLFSELLKTTVESRDRWKTLLDRPKKPSEDEMKILGWFMPYRQEEYYYYAHLPVWAKASGDFSSAIGFEYSTISMIHPTRGNILVELMAKKAFIDISDVTLLLTSMREAYEVLKFRYRACNGIRVARKVKGV
jgi:hypothetical protein